MSSSLTNQERLRGFHCDVCSALLAPSEMIIRGEGCMVLKREERIDC